MSGTQAELEQPQPGCNNLWHAGHTNLLHTDHHMILRPYHHTILCKNELGVSTNDAMCPFYLFLKQVPSADNG